MTKSDLVRKFIDENPTAKNKRDIARNMVRLYPDRFADIDKARKIVSEVTGTNGLKRLKNGKVIERMTNPNLTKYYFNGFDKWATENLNTDEQPWHEPFTIPTSIKQLNIIADLHSVHLNKNVFAKFIRETTNKEAVLINGDLLDSETLSRHLISHNAVEYDKEIEICRHILKLLKEEFTHVYFKEGNHDFWLERYLLTNSRAMLNTFRERGVNVKELLQCGGLGVHHIHNLKFIKYGDLDIIHGHEFPGYGSGKFPAVSLVDKWQTFKHSYSVKVLQAHSHRADHTITRKSKTGEFGEAWAMPAMCHRMAAYAPYAGWDNGWAVATQTDEGTQVKLIRL